MSVIKINFTLYNMTDLGSESMHIEVPPEVPSCWIGTKVEVSTPDMLSELAPIVGAYASQLAIPSKDWSRE